MKIYGERRKLIIFIIVLISLIFWARLWQLQIFADKYKQFAEKNVLQRRTVYPPRGLILDRNGEILVSNEAVYDLMVIPSQVNELDTATFCKLLDIEVEQLRESLNKARDYSQYKPSILIKNISLQTYGILQEQLYNYRGFFVQSRTMRKYPRPVAAHVLGYIGEVSEKQIEASDGYYKKGDFIGISGLERYYEKELRGHNGEKYVLVDVFNIEQGSYMNGELDQPSDAGKHLITSLDVDLQAYVERLFVNKKGGLVAIEPKTGQILAMVSSPVYDPSLLNGRERSENYVQLSHDPNKPLFNRAITAMYPPGSTFKVPMALIALDQDVIDKQTTYYIRGGYYLPGLKIGDHVFGPINLYSSIVKSSNAYYCHVFRALIDMAKFDNVEDGYNNWRNSVMEFGMGKKLNVDLNNEAAGILPQTSRYDKIYGEGRWKSSNILSLAIGQAEISLTPLQLANMTASVANRGYYVTPHLATYVVENKEKRKLEYESYQVDIDTAYFRLVIDAMEDVLLKGTAIRYGPRFSEYKICGKTGTSQNPHGEDHSVFICFAPKDDPKIAVAAVVENSGQGAHWAAPISFLAIEKYLSGMISSDVKYIEEIMLEGDFINPKEEEEEIVSPQTETEENDTGNENTIGVDTNSNGN